jgi:hypothetical protein
MREMYLLDARILIMQGDTYVYHLIPMEIEEHARRRYFI